MDTELEAARAEQAREAGLDRLVIQLTVHVKVPKGEPGIEEQTRLTAALRADESVVEVFTLHGVPRRPRTHEEVYPTTDVAGAALTGRNTRDPITGLYAP